MNEIIELGKNWKKALSSGNVDNIAKLYAGDAILWGTLSPVIRNTPELIREYFLKFATLEDIKVEFRDREVRRHGDIALNTGYYIFSWKEDGKMITVPGRYSFVYKFDGEWKIIDHHSSVIPEQPIDLSRFTED